MICITFDVRARATELESLDKIVSHDLVILYQWIKEWGGGTRTDEVNEDERSAPLLDSHQRKESRRTKCFPSIKSGLAALHPLEKSNMYSWPWSIHENRSRLQSLEMIITRCIADIVITYAPPLKLTDS